MKIQASNLLPENILIQDKQMKSWSTMHLFT